MEIRDVVDVDVPAASWGLSVMGHLSTKDPQYQIHSNFSYRQYRNNARDNIQVIPGSAAVAVAYCSNLEEDPDNPDSGSVSPSS